MANKTYQAVNQETGRLDPSIYTDEQIYREEMKKVFGRAWLLIGHDSLLPNPGNFFHTYMGEQPVILTRDKEGQVHALLNICRHRGARLVRVDDGKCNSFVCSYHAWTYGLDGKLEYVPGEQELYDGTLDKEQFGLKKARVATYAGLIFATWDPEAPSLEEYLGDGRWYLDTEFNRSAKGTIAYGPHKWIQPVNWKTAVDNSSDWYHVPYTHASAANALTRLTGAPRLTQDSIWDKKGRLAFVNGHQFAFFRMPEDKFEVAYGPAAAEEDNTEVIERLGEFRGAGVALGTHSLFPNTVLGFRLAIPRGPRKTEFWHFSVVNAAPSPRLSGRTRCGTVRRTAPAGTSNLTTSTTGAMSPSRGCIPRPRTWGSTSTWGSATPTRMTSSRARSRTGSCRRRTTARSTSAGRNS